MKNDLVSGLKVVGKGNVDVSGVYALFLSRKKKCYIGSTIKTIRDRNWDAVSSLNNQYHNNKELQKDFNKFGINNFKLKSLKEMPGASKKQLRKEERKYMVKYARRYHLYNRNDILLSNTKICSKRHAKRTNKIAIVCLGNGIELRCTADKIKFV